MGESIEITQEERDRIIRELKDPENESQDVCEFSIMLDNREDCSNITCRECSKIARETILALIESAPANGMQWPLDKDGIPIKPNDIVCRPVNSNYLLNKEYTVVGYTFSPAGIYVYCSSNCIEGEAYFLRPEVLVHKKPRTLDDIKNDAYESYTNLVGDEYISSIDRLIEESYELWKAAKDE